MHCQTALALSIDAQPPPHRPWQTYISCLHERFLEGGMVWHGLSVAGLHQLAKGPSRGIAALRSSQVRSYSSGYMEQAPSRGHEASTQSGLGVGCKLLSSSEKLRGLRGFSRSCLPRVAR